MKIHVDENENVKVENILKGSLDLIPSLSPSVKIQIIGGKVCLRCKGETLLGIFVFKSFLTSLCNVLPYFLRYSFLPIVWIFTESEGNRIKLRLPFKLFSTLLQNKNQPDVVDQATNQKGEKFVMSYVPYILPAQK